MIVAFGPIEQFVEYYVANFDHYSSLAEQLGRECEQLCKEEGIKAIVTWRPKSHARLRQKLRKRASGRNGYASIEEIKSDIVDLCGARISLYFPTDRRRASDLVKDRFNALLGKIHPEKGSDPSSSGDYHGHNLRGVREHPILGWVRIEIQVMTLLMNAWAEIGHDGVLQKSEDEITPEEELLLGEINQLVSKAEEKVEQYQILVRQRPRNQDRQFGSVYELLDFLGEGFLPEHSHNKWLYNTPRKDLLFWLVMAAGYDTRSKLSPLLSLNNPNGARRALTEFIFAQNPDLLMPYILQKSPHLAHADEERTPIEEAFANWRILDRVLRFLSAHNGNADRPFVNINGHIDLANLTEDEAKVVRRSWQIVDTLANAIARIRPQLVEEWNKEVSAGMQRLSSGSNPTVAAAFDRARS